jgi:16S rRNA (uracil1498-N3)-methyltransferase
MPRFHCDLPLAPGRQIELPLDAARHAVGALRLRDGDAVTLFNGDGAEYPAILELRGKAAFARITGRANPERESPLRITLAQGISSGERMDLTLQKAVELGISAIQPLMMRRTVVKLGGEKVDKRLRHWQGVVIAACEQCGRNQVPPVLAIQEGLMWLKQPETRDTPNRFLLDPEGDVGLGELAPPRARSCCWPDRRAASTPSSASSPSPPAFAASAWAPASCAPRPPPWRPWPPCRRAGAISDDPS